EFDWNATRPALLIAGHWLEPCSGTLPSGMRLTSVSGPRHSTGPTGGTQVPTTKMLGRNVSLVSPSTRLLELEPKATWFPFGLRLMPLWTAVSAPFGESPSRPRAAQRVTPVLMRRTNT